VGTVIIDTCDDCGKPAMVIARPYDGGVEWLCMVCIKEVN